jgi:hypothetical protein
MRTVTIAALCVTLAGCPSGKTVLWLAPDMAETAVKLVDTEPGEY